jgi:hypothetical protein
VTDVMKQCCHATASLNGVVHICNRRMLHEPPCILDLFKRDTPREPDEQTATALRRALVDAIRHPAVDPVVDRKSVATTDGAPPAEGHVHGKSTAPKPIDPQTGQHGAYWILSDAERAKGWQRPYRDTYVHRGIRPKYPTRDLTESEKAQYADVGYVKFEEYPESESPMTGRFWTAAQLRSGCGTNTTMGRTIAETYARDPGFYGATFCCHCGKHAPVAEFVWAGTDEVVGS